MCVFINEYVDYMNGLHIHIHIYKKCAFCFRVKLCTQVCGGHATILHLTRLKRDTLEF